MDGREGWAMAYAPLSNQGDGSADGTRMGGGGQRPELADVARLGRRALRTLVRAARADLTPSLTLRLADHLGPVAPDVAVVSESWRGYEHLNVQAGIEAWLAQPGRQHEVVGVTGFQHMQFGLADLLESEGPRQPWGPRPGNVATVNVACGPDGQVRACVVCAVYLVSDGERRWALLLRGPDQHGMNPGVTLQVMSTSREAAAEAAAAVRRLALENNAFRGQVLSFGGEVFDPGQTLLHFHRRPALDRTAVVLAPGAMEAIERQVVGIGRHRTRLLASGQHLKRGLLLYGPPGTGKTHTVRYLLGRTTGVTVVQLSGAALHLIAEACSVARALAPAMVVVEDVDLIAEDRGMVPGQHPLLFQLLNEMDGLAEDSDVVFVLTTNRADLLEPALAARPGRVDQAVELGLPDATARLALLQLYRGTLGVADGDLRRVAEATDGVTASFLKELLRRAALLAAGSGDSGRGDQVDDRPDSTPLSLATADLDQALAELRDTTNAMTRVLLGGPTVADA